MGEAMTAARTPAWSVTWDDRDVTRDLTPILLGASYQDSLDAEGATVELRLDNSDGRWQGAWSPSHGQRIGLSIGYVGESLVRPGVFEVDEYGVGPQVCTVSAISSRAPSLRSRASTAYESQTIADVVRSVADELGLSVVGSPPSVHYAHIARSQETPLAFLRRLARAHDCVVAVHDDQLAFTPRSELTSVASRISVKECADWTFKARSLVRYSACVAVGFDPVAQTSVEVRVEDSSVSEGDTLRLRLTLKVPEQLEARARAALARANRGNSTGSLELEGDPSCLAGTVIEVTDAGNFDGQWLIESSSHELGRDGYRMSLEVTGV